MDGIKKFLFNYDHELDDFFGDYEGVPNISDERLYPAYRALENGLFEKPHEAHTYFGNASDGSLCYSDEDLIRMGYIKKDGLITKMKNYFFKKRSNEVIK